MPVLPYELHWRAPVQGIAHAYYATRGERLPKLMISVLPVCGSIPPWRDDDLKGDRASSRPRCKNCLRTVAVGRAT